MRPGSTTTTASNSRPFDSTGVISEIAVASASPGGSPAARMASCSSAGAITATDVCTAASAMAVATTVAARSSLAIDLGEVGRGPGRSGRGDVDTGVREEEVGEVQDLLGHAVADVELGPEHGVGRAQHVDDVVPAGLATGRRRLGQVAQHRDRRIVGRSAGRACATPSPRGPGPRRRRGGRSAGAGHRARRRPRRSGRGRPPSMPRRRPDGRPCGAAAGCSAGASSTPSAAAASTTRLVSSRRTSAGAVMAGHTRSSTRRRSALGAQRGGDLVGRLEAVGPAGHEALEGPLRHDGPEVVAARRHRAAHALRLVERLVDLGGGRG